MSISVDMLCKSVINGQRLGRKALKDQSSSDGVERVFATAEKFAERWARQVRRTVGLPIDLIGFVSISDVML